MANEEHVALLRQGVEVWNGWRRENPDIRPDLSVADLRAADLSAADLSAADLRAANLGRADPGPFSAGHEEPSASSRSRSRALT
jgi:uncharacterized protein YjbI with pentapeptide repeats